MRAVAQVCRLCGRPGGRVVSTRDAFAAVRCQDCDFVTLHSGIDEARLAETYQEYLPTEPRAVARWRAEQQPVIRRAVRKIGALVAGGRLLDLGCGFGFFLAEMRQAGFDVEGLEVSEVGCRYARETLGLPVHRGLLEDHDLPSASFDVITAFYVIEHVKDPRAFLQRIHSLLRPGGLVFLRWPHTTPLAVVLDRFRVQHDLYHRPWHLSDFSPRSMHRVLAEAGFERLTTRTLGGTAHGGPLGSALSQGSAWLSDALEMLSGARCHLPGVSKCSYGFRR